MKCYIKEHSIWARLAAYNLKAESVAMVIGKTIHLYGSSAETFIENETWVRHEIVHLQQFQQLGFIKFLVLYTWYSFKFGYEDNPLEVEARHAEIHQDEWIVQHNVQQTELNQS
jgi:hypothetical protein